MPVAAEDEAEAAAPEGQYVEGDYGSAGTAGEVPPTAVEGEYAAGDYGEAGVAGAAVVGDVEGDYPEGDYGEGGVGPGSPVSRPASPRKVNTPKATTGAPVRPVPSDPPGRQRESLPTATPLGATTNGTKAGGTSRRGRRLVPCHGLTPLRPAGRFAQGETRARDAPEGLDSRGISAAGSCRGRALESKVESTSLNFGLTYVPLWVKLSADRSITVGPLRLEPLRLEPLQVRGHLRKFPGSKEAIHVTCSRY